MYPSRFEYHRPSSLPEAVRLIAEIGDDARVLAGGQSLVPMMKLRLASPAALVDLGGIKELVDWHSGDAEIRVGAMVRHRTFQFQELPANLPILRDAVQGIADQQVRNRGTMVGSIANADPGGDWAPVLLALEATVEIVSAQGQRDLPIASFFLDAYTTGLDAAEIIRAVRFPCDGRRGNAYLAFKRRSGDFAIASVAASFTLNEDGSCARAALALGNSAPAPLLIDQANAVYAGKHPSDPEAAKRLAGIAAESCDPFADGYGTVAYKRSLVHTLTLRALHVAARRSQGEIVDIATHR
jgi:carbon-monoxide dehydrogenase medium subunit